MWEQLTADRIHKYDVNYSNQCRRQPCLGFSKRRKFKDRRNQIEQYWLVPSAQFFHPEKQRQERSVKIAPRRRNRVGVIREMRLVTAQVQRRRAETPQIDICCEAGNEENRSQLTDQSIQSMLKLIH